jgi:hypothetical protein
MPLVLNTEAMLFILTCWAGQIGVMKSNLNGAMDILAPILSMRGTMSGVIGVIESLKVA